MKNTYLLSNYSQFFRSLEVILPCDLIHLLQNLKAHRLYVSGLYDCEMH